MSFFRRTRRSLEERVRPIENRLEQSLDSSVRFARSNPRKVLLGLVIAFFFVSGLILLWAASLKIPDLSSIENRKIEQSVKIYDRTGTVLLYDLNPNVDRTVVPLAQISPNIRNATIAIEDPTFYTNSGVSWTGIARAFLVDITTFNKAQGGSTLTQQVVKQSILTGDKSISRKLKEIILALKLTRLLSKDQILELYLNQAPYGGSVYGAEEASQAFFGKHASELDVAEAAYLAAVLPAPTYYSPFGSHRDALDARKNLVLDKMYEHGYLTAEEHDQAKQEAVTFQAQRNSSISAPHFVFYVEQYLEQKYGADALQQNSWKVTTTLDADLQQHAEDIVRQNALSNAQNFNASNAGLIAIDPKTGEILSMVGSRNYFDTQIPGNYNITLASRQPGSAFKPFAYAEAFIKGYTPDTVLFDLPTQFSTNCAPDNFTTDATTGCYSPVNYDNKFRGPMTLRNALAQSINVPSVETLYLAGIADTLRLAKAMGVSTLTDPNQYGLTLVLGGGEVTLLDMTSAYGTFATDGMHYEPHAILKIEDQNGNVIEDDSEPQGSQVLPPDVAQKINDILSDPTARAPLGENEYLSFPGHDVAVKTGTTNNYRDAWTIGYTPDIVIGIWAGNNDNTPMVKKVSGFIVGPMWHAVMQYALTKTPGSSFTRSEYSEGGLKPVLQGVWQGGDVQNVVGQTAVTCDVHSILYWVDKNDPYGAAPRDSSQDPQFKYWELPVQKWAATNGCTPGSLTFLPQSQPVAQPMDQTTPAQ